MYSPLFCWQTSMLWPVHSLGKAVSLCAALFCTERPNLPAIPGISFFFLFKIIFYSSIVNSQCFRYTADWFSYNIYIHTHIYIYMYVCVYCCYVVIQSCPALCDPVDWSPPGSSFHGISQARIWEWVATPSSIQIYLLTSYFRIPIPCDEKDFFFFGVSSRRSWRSL